ncbi:MAG: B12-binding domain-containing radical SAM protein [Proteobacteria bacterium]|nr:B12-binding domain-containing radical SAM protein [Pseudomonadota bacterium]
MKILLVLAKGQLHRLRAGPVNISFREAPLTATMLAALVPKELNASVKIIDESVSKIPFHETFDVVGISILTGTSIRGYQIADRFRERNTTVVLGGIHVTLMPDEARKHADSIITGFAEKTWPQLLYDFKNGQLKPEYHDPVGTIQNLPLPRRDLQKRFGYMAPNTVFATRGCKGRCDFCSVVAGNYGWYKRPVGEVIDAIKQSKRRLVVFNDVNLTEDVDYAKELFSAMIPLKKQWGGLASTVIGQDDELLNLMQKSGCCYILFGFETIDNASLRGIKKGFNKFEHYKLVVRKMHEKNIVVHGCFIFGMDGDTLETFDQTVEAILDLRIDIPRFALLTPYPKTALFNRLKAENRLLHQNWQYYDTQHVVIKPGKMTPYELDVAFKKAFKDTFSFKHIGHRLKGAGRNKIISMMGNLAYRKYVHRLMNDKDRFPVTFSADEIKN